MKCLDYFFNLLSRRDYTQYELLKKGQEKGFTEIEIAEAINELQEKDYQSDSRIVANKIASSTGKYGKSVVKRKCREKGINSEVFEEIWQNETENEETNDLTELRDKVMRRYKLETFQKIDPKTKTKLCNYLSYRGFNPWELLAQWQREEEE